MRLILASTSRYRRELMERLGVPFECVAPPFDEERAKAGLMSLPVPERALRLAEGKALSVSALHPDALVIGSDQIASIDGEALSKPVTRERAVEQLTCLAGREHSLVTAVVVSHGASGRVESSVDQHRMVMRALSPEAIARYVDRDAPLDCAGSYRVESLGISLFERVAGDDFTAVIGLPLTRVAATLARFGVEVP